MHRRFLAIATLLLSACASMTQDGRGYPSLARRPAETARVGGELPPDLAARPDQGEAIPADPALRQQIAALVAQAEKGRGAFDALYAQVGPEIRGASGAAVSSEAWVSAQVELTRLEEARYDSVFALASLDTLYADRMKAQAEGTARGGIAEIMTARRGALVAVDAQNDRIDDLKAALRQP